MLASLKNIFKVPELRNKVLFTLAIIAVYRFGAYLPVPGVDLEAVKQLSENSEQGGVLAFLSLFSGNALTRFSLRFVIRPLAAACFRVIPCVPWTVPLLRGIALAMIDPAH